MIAKIIQKQILEINEEEKKSYKFIEGTYSEKILEIFECIKNEGYTIKPKESIYDILEFELNGTLWVHYYDKDTYYYACSKISIYTENMILVDSLEIENFDEKKILEDFIKNFSE